jgi:AP-3 complex subunit beta
LSIGSVAIAFDDVCPTRLDLLHQQYRRLCRTLVDVDEWGQINLLNLLMRYARVMLPRPTVTVEGEKSTMEVDRDLQLLLTTSEPLLQSRNPAVSCPVHPSISFSTKMRQVVMAVARVFYYVGPPSLIPRIIHPLLRLLNVSKAVERVVLSDILILTQTVPVSGFFR